MSWAKFDDGFPNNPKVTGLPDVPWAKWLYTVSVCYAARNLTDGALTARAVKVLLAESGAKMKHVEELHNAGLWDRTADGYLIHDYLEYNPTAEEARAIKKARAEAGRRGGIKSGLVRRGEANAEANASHYASKQNGKPGGSTPSRPVVKEQNLGDQIANLARKAQPRGLK